MTDDPTLQQFQALQEQHLDVLCQNLRLVRGEAEIGRGFGNVRAAPLCLIDCPGFRRL
jgi:hypothetical protein